MREKTTLLRAQRQGIPYIYVFKMNNRLINIIAISQN
jgi:hypothetical protein